MSFRCAAEVGRCRGIADIDQTNRSIPIGGTHPGRFTRTGKIAHARHAKIARRVNVSQAVVVAPSGKSGSLISPSRAHKEGASRSSRNVVRDAMDVAASNDE